MEEHTLQCSFKGVKCPHNGCEAWILTSQLEAHVRECVYRKIKCKYCGQDLQYNQLAVSYVYVMSCVCEESSSHLVCGVSSVYYALACLGCPLCHMLDL